MKIVLFATYFIFLVSCHHSDSDPIVVESLSLSQKASVQSLIEQGILPQPQQTILPALPALSSCEGFIKSLPTDYFHNTILVPENKKDPQSPMIKIFYYGKIFNRQPPVIFFNGGPGSDSHSSYRILSGKQPFLSFNKISFVYMDQRGNGCSEHYPQGSDDVTLQRLQFYGSRQIVDDAEAVRGQLIGDKPWKAFGQSYGAFVVHRYAVLHPASLISVHAHAGVITSSPFFRLKGRIASQDRVLDVYLKDFPKDKESLISLKQALLGKCFQDETSAASVCGMSALSELINSLGFVNEWPVLHQWIQMMAPNGVMSEVGVKKYLQTLYFSKEVDPTNYKGYGKFMIDTVDRNVMPLTNQNCTDIYADLKIDPKNSLLNECNAPLSEPAKPISVIFQKISGFTKDLLALTDFKSVLQSSSLKFYLYSGQKDPYVPVEVFSEEIGAVRELVNYTHFLNSGHDGFYTEPLVWKQILK